MGDIGHFANLFKDLTDHGSVPLAGRAISVPAWQQRPFSQAMVDVVV
jgi:hypothetical protein